ncbi:DUF3806 domain-containing protein [Leptospira paudalimensis]|uniref:DUF3806 domain-containing protein n=1 Tax=Leptospira paudalimensis TaxID=2950024 RepID=A0ABT3M675_9LEPT|nr:DUF3806 domain-containing protein [Leptospira paudalimensis]MCW7503522.1 DUF3806 domain-containing protein [Leptospira paudalimensis]
MKKRMIKFLIIFLLIQTNDMTSEPIYKDKNLSIFPLNDMETQQLNDLRAIALKFCKEELQKEIKFPISVEDLQLATNHLNKKTDPNITYGIGVIIGDILVQKHNMKWLAVEDKFGRDPVIFVDRTLYYIGTLTLISKRIEDGEKIDIKHLISQIEDHMKENLKQYKSY